MTARDGICILRQKGSATIFTRSVEEERFGMELKVHIDRLYTIPIHRNHPTSTKVKELTELQHMINSGLDESRRPAKPCRHHEPKSTQAMHLKSYNARRTMVSTSVSA